MFKKETIIKDQKGIASMVIVILLMTLLSLIVMSMTQNANREQRQALDRQLNTQAFYVAESGVNDARDYYTKYANDPINPAPIEKTSCNGLSGANPGDQFPHYSSTVGNTINKYTCVLYDAHPSSLVYSPVSTSTSVLTPIQDSTGAKIKSLTFSWKIPDDSNYDFSGCPASGLPQNLTNCDAGLLRIELINIDDTLVNDRNALISNDFLAYALPRPNTTSNPANPNYGNGVGTSNQGVIWQGGCTNGVSGECSITINNINQNKLMLHMRSIYSENEVKITGVTMANNDILFKNAQLMVDSTGRGSDILKRIQVRVPLNDYGNGIYPEFALETANAVCKLQQVIPSGFADASSSEGCPN